MNSTRGIYLPCICILYNVKFGKILKKLLNRYLLKNLMNETIV